MPLIIRTYREGDERGIVELLKQCFPEFDRWGLTADDWISYEEGDYGYKRENALVAELDGRIVGHLHVVFRKVYLGASKVDICGIANVATHPDFRGRGIATSLVRKALDLCRERGISLASLLTGYGGEGYRVYRKIGFSNTTFLNIYVGTYDNVMKLLEGGGKQELDIEEMEERDVDSVMRLHDVWGKTVNLAVWRPREYWVSKIFRRFFMYSFFYDKPEASIRLLFKDSSRPIGYSLAFDGSSATRNYFPKDVGVVLEAVAMDVNYLKEVIKETLRRLASRGAKTFRLYLPTGTYAGLSKYFEEFKGPFLMDYVIDLKGLLDSMTAELSERAKYVDGQTSVTIRSPFGCVDLHLSYSEVRTSAECSEENTIELTRDGLIRAIYGVSSLSEMLDPNYVERIDMSTKAIEIMNTIFHKRAIYIPRIDQW